MKEQNILKKIMLSFTSSKTKIFRNNVGVGWAGRATVIRSNKTVNLYPGDVVIRQGRPLKAGLCKGSSDLIGWTETKITPEMVGRKLAVFTAVEVKNKKGRIRDEQIVFIDRVKESGGFAGVARSESEATRITIIE